MTEREELADELERLCTNRQFCATDPSGTSFAYDVANSNLAAAVAEKLPVVLAALRAQPQAGSVEQVELAAEAAHHTSSLALTGHPGGPWGEVHENGKEVWRKIVRAVIQSLQPDIASLLAAERERCAKVADAYARGPAQQKPHGENIAQVIRSLGSTGGV